MSVAKLKPFDLKQTREMMEFRWMVASGKRLPFAAEAIAEVFRITKGVPRSIVKLANEALIKTAVDNRRQVDKDTVVAASSELTVDES
jgi:type II secretory pathway predicted ATPase ExeA